MLKQHFNHPDDHEMNFFGQQAPLLFGVSSVVVFKRIVQMVDQTMNKHGGGFQYTRCQRCGSMCNFL